MKYPTLWRSNRSVSPWRDAFDTNLDRVFDGFFSMPSLRTNAVRTWSPVVDVRETDDAIYVTAELPGLTGDEVSVTLENGVLALSGEKKLEREEGGEDGNYHFVERRYGRFERSFAVPRSVDANKVEASFENGVLTVSLPKSAEAKTQKIEVK